MRYYIPTLETEPVRALVSAASDPASPAFIKALARVKRDLKRVDREEAQDVAQEAKANLRKHPALTTQKVIGVLRRSKLHFATYDSRGGTSTGLRVTYSDFERTSIKITYAFMWNWNFVHGGRGESQAAMLTLVHSDLFGTAQTALKAAGLKVTALSDDNPHLSRLEVRP